MSFPVDPSTLQLPSDTVLESAETIASSATHVTISSEGVAAAARKLLEAAGEVGLGEPEGKPALLEPDGLAYDDLLNWLFLLDTLNFCFWSDEDTLFTVLFRGKKWTGYRALVAALARAVEGGTRVYEPSIYGSLTLEQLRELFKSETHVPIPLLEQRLHCLHEAATILNKHYQGKVSLLVGSCNKSAVALSRLLATQFPGYRDVAQYGGKTVVFLKRAQIFPANLWNRFGGKDYGEFSDVDSLTMFADYRVPQCLQYFGVFHYSDELMAKLQSGVHLSPGSVEEVEIRGSSIWAVELIKNKNKLSSSPKTSGNSVISITIDFYLWNFAKSNPSVMAHLPIHRTRTIFY